MLIFFLIQISAMLVGTVGAILLFIYLFIDHDNKRFKEMGLIFFVTGFLGVLLISAIEMFLAF